MTNFGIPEGGDTKGSCSHCTRNVYQFYGQLPECLIKSICIQGRYVSDRFYIVRYFKIAKEVRSKNRTMFDMFDKISKLLVSEMGKFFCRVLHL